MSPAFTKVKLLLVCLLLFMQVGAALAQRQYPSPAQVSADFKALLDRPKVAFEPSFKTTKTDSVIIEKGSFFSEKNEKIPTLIYKPITAQKDYPVVIFLHGTGGTKESWVITDALYKLT